MIVLTSFVDGLKVEADERWSGARWAPKFAQAWPLATWAAPLRDDGSAVRLRDFGLDPLDQYREWMLALYRERWTDIREWLDGVDEKRVVLACWCPHTRVAKAQLAKFGTYHCHLGVVSEVLDGAEVEWEFVGDERRV